MPKISVITVVYNAHKTIERCIVSVNKQNFRDFEYIVIDGQSTDGTTELLKQNRKRIDKLYIESDDGLYDAMNRGIDVASGEYIFFLNADDFFIDVDILHQINDILIEGGPDILYGNVLRIDTINTVVTGAGREVKRSQLKWGVAYRHQGIFMKKSLVNYLGGFSLNYKIVADYDLFCRASKLPINSVYLNRAVSAGYIGGVSSDYLLAFRESARAIKDNFGLFYAWIYYIRCWGLKIISDIIKRLRLYGFYRRWKGNRYSGIYESLNNKWIDGLNDEIT